MLWLWIAQVCALSCFLFTQPSERITQFSSDISVHHDGSLEVTEEIVYHTTKADRHGITRNIPIEYTGPYGIGYTIPFNMRHIKKDGASVPYTEQRDARDIILYIGDPETYIQPGEHTYVISYVMDRQIGFFTHHDELYWNVIGTELQMPVESATAYIHLPSDIPTSRINAETFTDVKTRITISYDEQTVTIKPQGPIPAHSGLTVSVTWPKGYVQEPTWRDEAYYMLWDNIGVLFAFAFFILFTVMQFRRYRNIRRQREQYLIIPQFYPPEGISPGGASYILTGSYTSDAMAAEIVNLAVHQYIHITYHDRPLSGYYTLHRVKDIPSNDEVKYPTMQHIMQALFAPRFLEADARQKLRISPRRTYSEDSKRLHRAIQAIEAQYKNTYQGTHLKSHTGKNILSVITLTGGYAIANGLQPAHSGFFLITILFLLTACIMMIFAIIGSPEYTDTGAQLRSKILGFYMFLAAEEPRYQILSTPPTKTPELYETYLPYAIALGVENKWSQQFSDLFRDTSGKASYHPKWYSGHMPRNFGKSFSSHINRSLQSATTTRGAQGKGKAGGGRGGGGIGSW